MNSLSSIVIFTIVCYLVLREIALINLVCSKKGEKGYIYVFTDIGLIIPALKIGKTNNVSRRMGAHRTAAAFGTLHISFPVYNMSEVESLLHNRYNTWRIRGEWFIPSPFLLFDMLSLWIYLNLRGN